MFCYRCSDSSQQHCELLVIVTNLPQYSHLEYSPMCNLLTSKMEQKTCVGDDSCLSVYFTTKPFLFCPKRTLSESVMQFTQIRIRSIFPLCPCPPPSCFHSFFCLQGSAAQAKSQSKISERQKTAGVICSCSRTAQTPGVPCHVVCPALIPTLPHTHRIENTRNGCLRSGCTRDCRVVHRGCPC